MRRRWWVGTAAVCVLSLGVVAARSHLLHSNHGASANATQVAQGGEAGEEDWYCPMHPEVRKHSPDHCPICGMNLVRAQGASGADAHQTEASQFQVLPAAQQRLGLVIEAVQTHEFRSGLQFSGQVLADASRAVTQAPKAEGWIKRLYVASAGQSVRSGQPLYDFYSPDLYQRQRDYLDVLTRRDALSGGGAMAAVGNVAPDSMMTSIARERYRLRQALLAADVPEAVLVELEKSRRPREVLPVLAQRDGVVTAITAREGAFVSPGQAVLEYADLGAAAVELALSPEQLGALPARASVRLRSSVDRSVEQLATLDRGSVVIDPATRLARVRVALPANRAPRHAFPPGSLVEAALEEAPRQVTAIPRDAVLWSGGGSEVIVAEADDHFRAVKVELGAESRELVEVRSGLQPGQRLVVNGQFLLGAEASLLAARQRRAAAAAPSMAMPPAADMPASAFPAMHNEHGAHGPAAQPGGHHHGH